ncbi:Uncharacterized protein APZ42_007958 [Daphnia magna]|uniref:Uncharacterized protein n=1 Tax=Daphnia magna TaxID=35525 RepID=A0A164EYW0_9CRUS|nr:Uncharacterized protein APZ42_007958 [Daphnia magna]
MDEQKPITNLISQPEEFVIERQRLPSKKLQQESNSNEETIGVDWCSSSAAEQN